jgi:hypothetical protein
VTLLATVTDPSGRVVRLTAERWAHVLDGHPELEPCLADVLRAVEAPDRSLPGPAPGEEWFVLEGAGPSRWLQVVVAFSEHDGHIVTAFGRRKAP